MNHTKYKPFPPVPLPDRLWPTKQITKAPDWCSVDLRDGNQALEVAMSLEQKLEFFAFLTKIGFKDIEVGFPAASDTEFDFTRKLIDESLVPDGVAIQVLTQSREHIIERTFEALAGAKKAIVHLYNSTSVLQRNVVFRKSKEEIKEIAVDGAKRILALAEKHGRERFLFEYSPESFTGTELDYALEVCNAVLDVWQPSERYPVIINLPSTVEMATANVYADQIEYICRHIKYREHVKISLHAHNDRGTGVAATELAILAGADRVEGTLFGNGERTGNADIMTIALNLFSQGIDPCLDFSQIDEVVEIYERMTKLEVHPRHPYAGYLVFTAFSGSHQDAIKKGMDALPTDKAVWEVPYLPIDPMDVGRSYDPIIRINSQSGKGGVAYILQTYFGIYVPKEMQPDLGRTVTAVTDAGQKELLPDELYHLFRERYVNVEAPLNLLGYSEQTNGNTAVRSTLTVNGQERQIEGEGNGIIDAFAHSLEAALDIRFEVVNYNEHSMEYGNKSRAITYVCIKDAGGRKYFGAGLSSSISKSSLKAVLSAVNKMLAEG